LKRAPQNFVVEEQNITIGKYPAHRWEPTKTPATFGRGSFFGLFV
jgi:hypothetical protein